MNWQSIYKSHTEEFCKAELWRLPDGVDFNGLVPIRSIGLVHLNCSEWSGFKRLSLRGETGHGYSTFDGTNLPAELAGHNSKDFGQMKPGTPDLLTRLGPRGSERRPRSAILPNELWLYPMDRAWDIHGLHQCRKTNAVFLDFLTILKPKIRLWPWTPLGLRMPSQVQSEDETRKA